MESIDVPAAEVAGDNPPAAVPPPAADQGLATAQSAGPPDLTANPPGDHLPIVGSITVPAAAEAADNPAEAAPSDDATAGLSVAAVAGPP